MHRIGFRRALPLAFTLLHVVLVWFSLPLQPRTTRTVFHDSEHRAVAYQEGTGIPVETLGELPPLKPVQKMALIVELPAMFVAMLIGAVSFPRNDAAWLSTSVPLVPLVWYAIGRCSTVSWVNSGRLCLPPILRGLVTVLAVGVLFVSVAGLTPLYHHRTADTHWVFSGLVLWSGLCLAIVTSSARGGRK